jgi:hypothetical protein
MPEKCGELVSTSLKRKKRKKRKKRMAIDRLPAAYADIETTYKFIFSFRKASMLDIWPQIV